MLAARPASLDGCAMSFIIDGHNLIGVMPDINLADPDDEHRLLARLRAYRARSGGPSLIVFFDSGASPPGGADLLGQRVDPSSPGVLGALFRAWPDGR